MIATFFTDLSLIDDWDTIIHIEGHSGTTTTDKTGKLLFRRTTGWWDIYNNGQTHLVSQWSFSYETFGTCQVDFELDKIPDLTWIALVELHGETRTIMWIHA